MQTFFFPLLFWVPAASEEIQTGPFRLVPRRWGVSVFDLYSLVAERHPLRMPAELMQLFLPKVNLEVAVEAEDFAGAAQALDTLRALLYAGGMAPTLAPFATNYSLNAYAGTNSRSSERLRPELPVGMQDGINAKEHQVEGWPYELSFMCLRGEPKALENTLSPERFTNAARSCAVWGEIESAQSRTRTLRAALAKAPLMPDLPSSILSMWQALESLFDIDKEITYRTSLMLAELCSPICPRLDTYNAAKKSYGDRSKIAHGSSASVTNEQWGRAWYLLRLTARGVMERQKLPSVADLTTDMLTR